jgi:hypothetical protein
MVLDGRFHTIYCYRLPVEVQPHKDLPMPGPFYLLKVGRASSKEMRDDDRVTTRLLCESHFTIAVGCLGILL